METKYDTIIEKFLTFESDNNLFDLKVKDTHFWHLIRFQIYNKIESIIYDVGRAHGDKKSFRNNLILILYNLKYLFIRNVVFYNKKIDYLFMNHPRRVMDNNVYKCLYTDNLISSGYEKYLIIEDPYQGMHKKLIPNRSIVYTDSLFLFREIKFLLSYNYFKNKEANIIKSLIYLINKEFKIDLDEKFLTSLIKKSIITFEYFNRKYKKLLLKTKPNVIIQVVSYTYSRLSLNYVAKTLNIPTIELQHGTMGKYHIAYNFKEKVNLPTFPDYIFIFGKFWKENTRFPISENKIKIVGWPYLEKKVSEFQKKSKENSKKNIIFLSQGTIGIKFTKFALDFCNLIDLTKYKVILKLHPGEYGRWKKEYPWLIDSKIEVIDHNKHDIHYYFAKSDIQVGVSSTALFEGLAYGLKTYVYKAFSFNYMEELYESGYATLVDSPLELINEIEDYRSSEIKTIQYFWEQQSINKMFCAIKNIIDDGECDEA
ncbi:hypothetical protein KHQ88_04530 [Mycoplasmatota bacterium]|nr:hypothetical protein KHQ88_04530 [Mycoplasmatota bacterium]